MNSHTHSITSSDLSAHSHTTTNGLGIGVGVNTKYVGQGLYSHTCSCCGEKLGDSVFNPHIKVEFTCDRKSV